MDWSNLIFGLAGILLGAGPTAIALAVLQRKWAKQDKQETKEDTLAEIKTQLSKVSDKLETLTTEVGHVKAANKSILSDRIKWLGTKYIEAGEITFEDRQILHDLHDAYHNHSGGNGDYKLLMQEVDELPLKRRETA